MEFNFQSQGFNEQAQRTQKSALSVNAARLARMRAKRRKSVIRTAVIIAIVAAAVLVYLTGLYGTSISLLGDAVDSITIALTPGGGFPSNVHLDGVKQAFPLSGGFAAVGTTDLMLYSSSGNQLRNIQHGYARPSITVGNSRVCIYSRSASSLRVESRTRNLFTHTFDSEISLATMSDNGTLAVFTQTQLAVYNPQFEKIWTWNTSETPLAMTFASDNKQFAAGCLKAENGALGSVIHLFDTRTEAEVATISSADAIPLRMRYVDNSQILIVYDSYLALFSATTGEQLARYDYANSALQSVDFGDKGGTALLFGSDEISGISGIVLLDDTLQTVGSAAIQSSVLSVVQNRNGVYVLTDSAILSYSTKGEFHGETAILKPAEILFSTDNQLLLFTDGNVALFTPPVIKKDGTTPGNVQYAAENQGGAASMAPSGAPSPSTAAPSGSSTPPSNAAASVNISATSGT